MRLRPFPAACLAAVLLGLAWTSFALRTGSAAAAPAGDEATYASIAASLWHEHDLTYDHRDLLRFYRTWNEGPAGLTLLTTDGGRSLRFAAPFAYGVAALPFYGLLGPAGLPVFNMLLYLAMLAGAAWLLREETGAVGPFLAGFFFLSAGFADVFRAEPRVFLMAAGFFPLLVWSEVRRRDREPGPELLWVLAGAGALLAAGCLHRPSLALLGGVAVLDLAFARRWRSALALALPALLAFGLLLAVQHRMTGVWSPGSPKPGVLQRSFETEFPIESQADLWQAYAGSPAKAEPSGSVQHLPLDLGYFLAGRDAGLLPFFPFALFALILGIVGAMGVMGAGRFRTFHRMLLLAIVGLVLVDLLDLVGRPHGWNGGPGAIGNDAFAEIAPALLFLLPGRLSVRRSLALPYAAAALWTGVAVAAASFPGWLPFAPASVPTFRILPIETTLLARGALPGWALRTFGDELWIVPRSTFYIEEQNPEGIWVRGATRSEVFVVTPRPLDKLRFEARSLSLDNEVTAESGRSSVVLRFDRESKLGGAVLELPVRPMTRRLGFLGGAGAEYVYRFTLTTTDGIIPARRFPPSQDGRYLGTFLSPLVTPSPESR
jgi:hypothetical protein